MQSKAKASFDRIVEADVEYAATHRAKVRFEGGKWTARCFCLWRGPGRATMAEAETDAEKHS